MFTGKLVPSLTLGAALWLLSSASVCAQEETAPAATGLEPRKIVILHTNDVHGRVGPERGRGGLTRIATLVKQYRAANPNNVIYLDAGDVAQGTPVSSFSKGAAAFSAIAAMHPAAGTIGNHEFDWGVDQLLEMTVGACYPFVVANVLNPDTNKPIFAPYLVTEVDGIKVGIIGVISKETVDIVKRGNTGGLIFVDPATTVRNYLPAMREKGAQLIVALSHCGLEEDKQLAAAVPEIDFIVGGHTHDALEHAINIGGHTWIAQAGKYAQNLGVNELSVSPYNGKILGVESKLIPIGEKDTTIEDPEVLSILKKYEDKVKPIMAEVVGKLKGDFSKQTGEECADCPLGNAICEAMCKSTNSDVAFYNFGGIRLDKLKSGEVTRGDFFALMPFDDALRVLQVKGSVIKNVLDYAAAVKGHGPIQGSGFTCTLDKAKGEARDIVINGEPLDLEKTYRLATTEFLAGGGDGFGMLRGEEVVENGEFAREVMVEYLKGLKEWSVPATGNMKVVKHAIESASGSAAPSPENGKESDKESAKENDK